MVNPKNNSLDLSFFKKICETSCLGVAIYDSDLTCMFINKQTSIYMNINAEDSIGKKIEILEPGIKETDRYAQYCETLKTGKLNHIYFCNIAKDKSSKQTCFNIRSLKVEDKLVLMIEKITNEQTVEHQKGLLLKSLMDNLSANVFLKDNNFKYIAVNKACADFYGLKISDMIGKTDCELLNSKMATVIRKEDEDIIKGKNIIEDMEEPFMNPIETVWVSKTKMPLRDSNGIITGIFGIIIDITDRKIVESEMELLIATMYQTSETIIITDKEGVIQYVNPAFEKTSGYSMEETIGNKPSILKSGKHDNAFYEELWRTIDKGKSWLGHFINKHKNGTLYEENATISPIRNKDGDITNYVALKKDVSYEVNLESQLRQSQKMEAIGRLAGGIAHDFNNILTAILGYSELILLAMDKEDKTRKWVQEIFKAGKSASALTAQMLTFSKKQVVEHKRININETIKAMLDMLKRIIGENIKLEVDLCKTLDEILTDKTQLEQVLLNLVINAKEAMQNKGGEIIVKTSNYILVDKFQDGNFEAPPGPYIKISIEDNGCGMGEETLDRIFEPFFSRKDDKSGTGLGLSTVYGIVKQHDGFIEISSTSGHGSTFNISFPSMINEEQLAEAATSEGNTLLHDFSGNILIVEDENAVLQLSTSILKFSGYTVTTASSAEDALEIFDKTEKDTEESFDLLITDIVLPGMSGNELAAQLKEKDKNLKVLFMSAYPGSSLEIESLHLSDDNFISKPFSIGAFSKKVLKVLTGKS